MTSKHTPGNWRVTIDDRIETHYHSNGNGKMVSPEAASHQTTKTICKIERGLLRNVLNEEERANANLIAAAPDMLQLIDECETAFHVLMIGSDHGITPQAMEACQAAYKKCHEFLNSFRKEAHNG